MLSSLILAVILQQQPPPTWEAWSRSVEARMKAQSDRIAELEDELHDAKLTAEAAAPKAILPTVIETVAAQKATELKSAIDDVKTQTDEIKTKTDAIEEKADNPPFDWEQFAATLGTQIATVIVAIVALYRTLHRLTQASDTLLAQRGGPPASSGVA